MLDKAKGPAAGCNGDEPPKAMMRKPKRKLGNVWSEDRGRYLCRYGNNGTTIFDVWKLIGEPLPFAGGADGK